jgi:threonine/homoserine/homoserine lactone efflux protein
MLTIFFEGILLGLLVAVSLGPAFFAIIQTGITKGFKYGIYMAMGVSSSDILLVIISYLIGAQLFDDPNNKVYVGLIGGIILIIFGSISWAKKPEILKRKKYNPNKPPKNPHPIGYVVRGFFLNIANPFLFFFWFGALGFVGKNAEQGKILESTIVFFAGTFATIFSTDVLKSFIGGKIKGYLKPRKEIILNKIVGIALVIFGVILIFRTLDDYGFFEYLKHLNIQYKP